MFIYVCSFINSNIFKNVYNHKINYFMFLLIQIFIYVCSLIQIFFVNI